LNAYGFARSTPAIRGFRAVHWDAIIRLNADSHNGVIAVYMDKEFGLDVVLVTGVDIQGITGGR
jgi:hypothetical protein